MQSTSDESWKAAKVFHHLGDPILSTSRPHWAAFFIGESIICLQRLVVNGRVNYWPPEENVSLLPAEPFARAFRLETRESAWHRTSG